MRFRSTLAQVHICCTLLFLRGICFSQSPPHAEKLISRLGCGICHTSLKIESDYREKLPNLSYAGLRYNPAYLFDFLLDPTKIRQHLGPVTMPNFHLSEEEALALILFLETQNRLDPSWPAFPPEFRGTQSNRTVESGNQYHMLAIEDTTCLSCHSMNGKGGVFAVGLETIGYRLKSDWVKKYLTAPSLFDVPNETMLAVFYTLSRNRRRLLEIFPGAAEQINRITDHLFSLNRGIKEELENTYQTALNANAQLSVETGEHIFRSQNCSACHTHRTIQPPNEIFTPDLTIEGLRVDQEWLIEFLKTPYPIRPFGFQPGTGNRMPDFNLSDAKIRALTGYLENQNAGQLEIYIPQDLTAFSMNKAQAFLEDKLSCLGCHRLGEQGGKIGPDLSSIRERLNPFYNYNQIIKPGDLSPNAIMPRIPLQEKTQKLIFNFLIQQNTQRADTAFLSLVENPPVITEARNSGENNYLKYCSICHGLRGDGDGYNAPFLPVKPTVHSDSAHMSRRPDDTLFDGIYAGGYILNKSHFMPPWGLLLSREEIEALVVYMRELCNCQGPEWSMDDKISR